MSFVSENIRELFSLSGIVTGESRGVTRQGRPNGLIHQYFFLKSLEDISLFCCIGRTRTSSLLVQFFFHFHAVLIKHFAKQVCSPVGCETPACCPYLPACTAPGGGICYRGGGGVSQHALRQTTLPCEQNHRHV